MSFTCVLYSNQSDRKSVVKSLDEIVQITESFQIKEPSSIINPVIILSRKTVGKRWADVNYAYIPEFKRFYFVDNISISPAGLAKNSGYDAASGFLTLEMSIDVLHTYRSQILDSQQQIARCEFINSALYVDTELPIQANKIVNDYQIGLFPESTGNNYVLTTAGGS